MPPDEKPIDLDDADRPRKRRRPVEPERESPPPHLVAANAFGVVKWVSLGVGVLLIVVALSQAAPWAAAFAGMACFAGIVARVFQAEEHQYTNRGK